MVKPKKNTFWTAVDANSFAAMASAYFCRDNIRTSTAKKQMCTQGFISKQ